MRRHLLLLLIVLLPACTSWQGVELPAPAVSEWSAAGTLRLTTRDGARLRGDSAWVAGDTLRLRVSPTSTAGVSRALVAGLERHGFDGGRTTGLGLGLAALSVFMVLIGNAIEESLETGLGSMTWVGAP